QHVAHNFFFSSRSRHTRWPRDWSSDVCSSDLIGILGWPEIPRLPLTHRAAILDNNHVARGTPRRDLLTLRLHVARPSRWVGDNGADADAEYFQQFAAAHLFNSFSHVFLLTSNLKNSITSLING